MKRIAKRLEKQYYEKVAPRFISQDVSDPDFQAEYDRFKATLELVTRIRKELCASQGRLVKYYEAQIDIWETIQHFYEFTSPMVGYCEQAIECHRVVMAEARNMDSWLSETSLKHLTSLEEFLVSIRELKGERSKWKLKTAKAMQKQTPRMDAYTAEFKRVDDKLRAVFLEVASARSLLLQYAADKLASAQLQMSRTFSDTFASFEATATGVSTSPETEPAAGILERLQAISVNPETRIFMSAAPLPDLDTELEFESPTCPDTVTLPSAAASMTVTQDWKGDSTENMLSVHEGDIIEDIDTVEEQGNGWVYGRIAGTEKQGYVPGAVLGEI